YSFWVACDDTSTRTEAVFSINAGPLSASVVGSATGCGTYEATVTIDDPTGTMWVIYYTIVGDSTNTEYFAGVISNNPDIITINEPAGTQVNIIVVSTVPPGCRVTATETLTITAGGKVWNGSVNTDWFIANNWTPSGIPDSSDCVVIPDTSSGSGNEIGRAHV